MSTPATSVPRPRLGRNFGRDRHAAVSAGLTVGVEEEFFLVDACSGRLRPQAQAVLRGVCDRVGPTETRFQAELLTVQVEAATGVCTGLGPLTRQLLAGRRALAAAAGDEDVRLVSSGTPVLAGAQAVSGGERYLRIGETFAGLAEDHLSCGCHVHVGVPDRDTAVAVVNHLRPWLPTLLALSTNSIFDDGRDTGYGSWRIVQLSRFPGAGVPPCFSSAADYDEHVARMVDCGSIVDTSMTFWLARPSCRFPTVEVRAADAAGTVAEAVLQAALARALVRTALARLTQGLPAPAVSEHVAAAALWSAARYGLRGPGVHPTLERRVPALSLLRELLDDVTPALEDTSDLATVRSLVDTVVTGGTGAQRQRRVSVRGPSAVLDMLAEQTIAPGHEDAGHEDALSG